SSHSRPTRDTQPTALVASPMPSVECEPPQPVSDEYIQPEGTVPKPQGETTSSSRASPGLGTEEIQAQVFDPTSGVTFLHRAWKRLSRQQGREKNPDDTASSLLDQPHFYQPWVQAGD